MIGAMEYPYDAGLDAPTLALLAGFRADEPNEELDERMTALIKPEMPADLKAWLHTYAAHGGLVSVGDIWFESNNVGMLREIVDAFEPDDERLEREGIDGLELDQAVVMANTADGEVFFAAAWRLGDARMTVVKFCCAGYDNDGYHALGSFVDALKGLADDVEDVEDIDEPLRAVLAGDRADEAANDEVAT